MARKQEQEKARDTVTEVAPDVLRMELDIRLPGLGHVNCYALLDDEGAALVDPGLPGKGTHEILLKRLAQCGLKLGDIHTVLVTHSHPDHFGGADRIARASGAKVVGHEYFSFGPATAPHSHEPEVSVDDLAAEHDLADLADLADREDGEAREEEAPSPRAQVAHYEPPPAGQRARGTPWGGESARPPWRMRLVWQAMRWLGRASWVPTITHPVREGDLLRLAKREWRVVHTPGHTEDHFCLHDPETGTFLAGDHVLPTITPHISGLSHQPDPLNTFFDSLDLVAAIPGVGQVLPAHGHPFEDLAGRARAIKQHHHERLDRIRQISLELGPATVTAISHQLFRERSWGAMAESETYAHLEHLRVSRDAECYEDGGKLIYVVG